MAAEVDLLIVGGGITGLSLAVHAARDGLSTVLVEAGDLGGVSTQRSGALVRTHYEDASSAALALRGLELFERFDERYGGPSGFHATGFAYVPTYDERDAGTVGDRVEMLQGLGVETRVVGEAEMGRIDPALDISDVGMAVYEPRSGFASPALTASTLTRAAADAGAQLRSQTRALELIVGEGGAVEGAVLAGPDGVPTPLTAGNVVLCSGAWSPVLASTAGVELAIRPTAVKLAFVERRGPFHLTVIDAPAGIYLRPDHAGSTLVGRRTWTDEPMGSPDAELPAVESDFLTDAAARLARRIPSAAGAQVVGSRAGMLDMTPDGLPLVGPAMRDGDTVPGLWLCCGWSGTGFKTGPPVGEALAEWIRTGSTTLDLSSISTARELEPAAAAVRSPH
ncbi:MAG: FAD-binding oxidoreductase [Solirubrobacteraceae bacterium]|nr:FAD-binding oxidoreductase [Solirubrobacteraceae bacterium]